MTERDVKILNAQTDATLIRWYHTLNNLGWADELPDPEPVSYVHGGRRWQIMKWIEESVSLHAILREHNREMTDQEFRDLWRGFYYGDKAAEARAERYIEEKVAADMGRKLVVNDPDVPLVVQTRGSDG